MGLNRLSFSPCGFAFVEYLTKESAQLARNTLMGTILDGKEIRVDTDIGFEDGRQYGRGRSGCQRRDEMRKSYDPDRPFNKKFRQYSGRSNSGNYRY